MEEASKVVDAEVQIVDEDENDVGEEDHEDDALPRAAQDSDDSVASDATVHVEASCEKANSLSFHQVCKRLEGLWRLKVTKRKKKVTDEEKKKYILPVELLKMLHGESIFPLLRLLLPDQDSARNPQMKEKTIAQAYCDAMGFAKGTSNYEALYYFTDPQRVPHSMAGDLSRVVEDVLKKRIPDQPSKLNLGQINQLLDELAALKSKQRSSYQHEWRESQQAQSQQGPASGEPKKKKTSITLLREKWLRKVLHKNLSPLEHKWLVRIILQKMEFGLGWRALLHWYSRFAIELWNSHNSLKNLCAQLALGYHEHREEEEARNEAMKQGQASRWEPQTQPAGLGNILTPMLSSKVKFSTCMTQIQYNHAEYLKTSELHPTPLTLKYPPICVEIKLDGERMVVHVQDGEVTMLTRNGKWYSELYSPVIGPPLRRALAQYNINCILDGEIESWDNGREELIPFGNNRTVANYRRLYLRRHGKLDPRDSNLHRGTTDAPIMRVADENKWLNENFDAGEEPGKDCWLQFLVFDILFVDGPDAPRLFRDCGLEHVDPGSIIHLSTIERKKILYQVIQEQKSEVEIAQAVVVRPTGDCLRGAEYFSSVNAPQECGHPLTLLDSTQAIIAGRIPNLEEIDRQRRRGRADAQVSKMRAEAIDSFYNKVVEVHRFEGLVLKDLAAPYILGDGSRKRHYWHKFKPDYERQAAADIDVIILGGYFATGLRHSGRLSHFLVGRLDSADPSAYMTLCNVNGGSVNLNELNQIMKATGFQSASETEETQLGKWFVEDDHRNSLPGFISRRSLQRGGKEDYEGWTCNKSKNYPDLWISPEDSVVLTIHGQEFVDSDEYSVGISLRFARIAKVRHESVGDPKAITDIETDESLWRMYVENMRQRQETAATLGGASVFSPSSDGKPTLYVTRFLTPEEYSRSKKKRKRKMVASPARIPKVREPKSSALKGLSFAVFEGNYRLDPECLEAREAQEQGWLQMALGVTKKEDVMEFILEHGGTIRVAADNLQSFVIGGSSEDVRVINYMKGIEYAKVHQVENPKTKRAQSLRAVAQNPGVLKWTFVFSLVFQARKQSAASHNDDSQLEPIQKTNPILLVPKSHQYLARSQRNEGILDELLDLGREAEINKIDLMRALEEFEASEQATPVVHNELPWQLKADSGIPNAVSEVLVLGQSVLWAHVTGSGESITLSPPVLMYADVFPTFPPQESQGIVPDSDIASSEWERVQADSNTTIMSVLPLARAMGAWVTPVLDRGVSYIICELEPSIQTLPYQKGISGASFSDSRHGKSLLDFLGAMEGPHPNLIFVSPIWLRMKWQESRPREYHTVACL